MIYRLTIRITVIFLMLLSFSALNAQQSQAEYFMRFPQASYSNPAFRPVMDFYVGLPVISGLYLNTGNNMFSLSELFRQVPGTDSVITIIHPDYDRKGFLNSLSGNGRLEADASVQLLGIGFVVNDNWFIDIGLSEKAILSAYVPKELFSLLLEGNEGFVGSTIDLSGLGFSGLQYMESSVGVSRSMGSRLRLGGRFKFLLGGAAASLSSNQLSLTVNEDYSHTLTTDLNLNLSGPFTVTVDEDGFIEDIQVDENIDPYGVLFNSRNRGMAFDLGAEYRLFNNLSLSASIVDIGFIGWKHRTFNLEANNNFTFDGFDLTEVIEGDITFDEMITQFSDSLKNSFTLTNSNESFRTWIPAKIFLGVSYTPIKILELGMMGRSVISQGHLSQSLSLSANLHVGDILSTSLVYTMTNRTYSNFGFGLSVRVGPVQIYSILDQIPLGWTELTFPDESKPVKIPNRVDYMNIRAGINLVFGKIKQKGKDTPMLYE